MKKKNVKSLKLKVQKVQTVQLWLLYRTGQSESVRTVMCSVLLVLYSRTLALRWNRWLWSQSADFHLGVSFPASYRRRFQTHRQDDEVLLTDQVGHFASVQLIVCFTAEKPAECKVLPKPVRGDSCSGIGPAEQPNIEEETWFGGDECASCVEINSFKLKLRIRTLTPRSVSFQISCVE